MYTHMTTDIQYVNKLQIIYTRQVVPQYTSRGPSMGSEGETAVVKTATHRHLWSKRRGQNGHPQAPVGKTAWSKRPSTSPCGQNGVVKTAVHGLVVKPACGQNGQTCVVKTACGQNGHY